MGHGRRAPINAGMHHDVYVGTLQRPGRASHLRNNAGIDCQLVPMPNIEIELTGAACYAVRIRSGLGDVRG
jgi:hypothetical protein